MHAETMLGSSNVT